MADDEFTKGTEGNDEGKPKDEPKGEPKSTDEPKTPQQIVDEHKAATEGSKPDDKPDDDDKPPATEGERITAGVEAAMATMSLSDILKHPILGPILNSWADKSGNAQAATAVTQAQTGWEEEAALKVLEERFENMSEEDLGRALREPETAVAFANLIARRTKVAEEASEEAVARKGQVYGYAVQVGIYTKMLKDSGLPAEQKTALHPDKFAHLGSSGIMAWGTAIQEALLEHASDAKARALLDTKWEAHLEEKEGGGGGASRDKTDVSNGRPRGPITAEMLKDMTPQEVMLVPIEQRDAALKAQAARPKR